MTKTIATTSTKYAFTIDWRSCATSSLKDADFFGMSAFAPMIKVAIEPEFFLRFLESQSIGTLEFKKIKFLAHPGIFLC
jgi:hypothetical protein